MTEHSGRLESVIADIDALNAGDPRGDLENGLSIPQELLYARRMSEWLTRLYPDASEELRIAARAQHICRWQISRDAYARGRDGYNAWRRACREHHASIAATLMRRHGYGDPQIAQVSKIIRKEELKRDPESQALENIAALVFVRYYLADFVAGHPDYDDPKLVDILKKTMRKMDETGRAALVDLPLPPELQRLASIALS